MKLKKALIIAMFCLIPAVAVFSLAKLCIDVKNTVNSGISYESESPTIDYEQEAKNGTLDSDGWIEYGFTFEDEGDYEEAIKCFEKAIELDKKNDWAYYSKGRMLYNLEKYEEALEYFTLSLEVTKEEVDKSSTLVCMAECNLFLDINQAIDCLKEAKSLDTESYYEYEEHIKLYTNIRDAKSDDVLFQCVYELLDSDIVNYDPVMQKNIANYYREQYDNEKFHKELDKILEKWDAYWNEE